MTPDAWLRGPVDGVISDLQPVAHALIQAHEDLECVVPRLSVEELWVAPGGAASPGFHLRHLATEKEPQPDLTPELLLHG